MRKFCSVKAKGFTFPRLLVIATVSQFLPHLLWPSGWHVTSEA